MTPAVADKIGEIMGVSAGEDVKKVAFVKCAGTCDKASVKANYYGISDYKVQQQFQVAAIKHVHTAVWDLVLCAACGFDAIHIEASRLWIKKSCVACGKCAEECPNHLIELIDTMLRKWYPSELRIKDQAAVCESGLSAVVFLCKTM